jgi:RNA polymerase sigma-70 factor (ECF subfamily)
MLNGEAAGSPDSFPTTQWTLVGDAARGLDPERRREAMGQLLERYLPALRRAVTRIGVRGDQVEDLLQGFICDRVMQQNILSAADQTRGRFRSFIFTSLRNFVFNQARAGLAAKRSPERLISLDGENKLDVPAGNDDARDAFDEAWVRDVLQQTLARMRTQCDRSRDTGQRVWQVFEWRVVAPSTEGVEPLPYDDIAVRLGGTTPLQAANLLVTAKRMFARELRSVVAEYTRDEDELEEEIRSLKAVAG